MKKLFLLLLLTLAVVAKYGTEYYDWTVWVPEEESSFIKAPAEEQKKSKKRKNKDQRPSNKSKMELYGPQHLYDFEAKKSLTIHGIVDFANLVVKNNLTVHGPMSGENAEIFENMTNSGPLNVTHLAIGKKLISHGPVNVDDIVAESIEITGPANLSNAKVNDLSVHGPLHLFSSDIKNVTVLIGTHDTFNPKILMFSDVKIDTLIIESSKKIKIKVCDNSIIKSIVFTKKAGKVIEEEGSNIGILTNGSIIKTAKE